MKESFIQQRELYNSTFNGNRYEEGVTREIFFKQTSPERGFDQMRRNAPLHHEPLVFMASPTAPKKSHDQRVLGWIGSMFGGLVVAFASLIAISSSTRIFPPLEEIRVGSQMFSMNSVLNPDNMIENFMNAPALPQVAVALLVLLVSVLFMLKGWSHFKNSAMNPPK